MEEDDDDDDNDYDYIKDKLLSANTTTTAIISTGGGGGAIANTSTANNNATSSTTPSTAGGGEGGQQPGPQKQVQQNQTLQNLLNGDSADKSVKKQRVWKKDMLRTDDFSKMKEMVQRLRKHRVNEVKGAAEGTGGAGGMSGAAGKTVGAGMAGKSIPARTSIQQTQGSNNLIKKETANRRTYLNK